MLANWALLTHDARQDYYNMAAGWFPVIVTNEFNLFNSLLTLHLLYNLTKIILLHYRRTPTISKIFFLGFSRNNDL